MKKDDFLWLAALSVWVFILVIPFSREMFMEFSGSHPYISGFIKFGILASMGDLLGTRLAKGKYIIPKGVIARAAVWGFIGMMVSLVFTVVMEGVGTAQKINMLPLEGTKLAQAFFGSTFMNLTFGPMMMAFHRFTDLYIDAIYEKKKNIKLSFLVDKVDWHALVEFSWVKMCTLFWIPAHTFVFMLPKELRVLVSAFLSIALGLLLAIARKEKKGA
ncbi:hypothetical protein [Sedimentibacter sp.]|uniref:hypothetical protein n=1 Tax=Sedimentibacter sp. TaxID=1960295 RepID=UPI00289F018B|nr:hypothetical protein [Sedimentibacter sp.]